MGNFTNSATVRIRLNMLRTRGVPIREGRGGAHREFTYKLLRAGRCREGGPREGSRARSARTAVATQLDAATALFVRPSLAAFFRNEKNRGGISKRGEAHLRGGTWTVEDVMDA
jgi:hypothetical protein